MRIYSEYITLHTEKKREFVNLTPNVKTAIEKSGLRDGIIVVLALHANSAIFVNDDEAGLLEDIAEWLDKLVPSGDTYHHNAKGSRAESSAAAHLQGLLLNQQAVLSFTEGRLEMGPWQQLIYAELDGQRPKRLHIKLLGE